MNIARLKKYLGICVAILVLPCAVGADILEVSKSKDHYQSIQKAIDAASSGDTIKIHQGTYHESLVINKPNLTLQAYDPMSPATIDGADLDFAHSTPKWTHVKDKIYKTPYTWYQKQLTDDEFSQYTGGKFERTSPMQVYEDDILLRGYRNKHDPDFPGGNTGSGYGGRYRTVDDLNPMNDNGRLPTYKPDIRIPGRFMVDESKHELYIWSAQQDHPSKHIYHIPVIRHLVRIQAPRVVLSNLVFKHATGYAIALQDAHHAIIKNSYFINSNKNILLRSSDDVKILDNFFQQKGFWNRYWYDDCKHTVLHGGTIYSDNEIKNLHISGNTFHGFYGAFYGRTADGTRIFDNLFSHTLSFHIWAADGGADFRVYHNILHHNDDAAIGLSYSNNGGPIWIYRNVFYATGKITKDGNDNKPDVEAQAHIYNNTIALAVGISHHPYGYPPYKKKVFRNNIFQASRSWRYFNKEENKDWSFFPFINGPDSDYNLHWPNSNKADIGVFKINGSSSKVYSSSSFKNMQTDTGLDKHGLLADPIFINHKQILNADRHKVVFDTFSTMDYRKLLEKGYQNEFSRHFKRLYHFFTVSKDSPAINRGTPLPKSWPDTATVIDGKPDIGAMEYNTSAELLPPANLKLWVNLH